MDTPDPTELCAPFFCPLSSFSKPQCQADRSEQDVSMCPYNQTDDKIHGFLGTHQPAIWMGMPLLATYHPEMSIPLIRRVQVNLVKLLFILDSDPSRLALQNAVFQRSGYPNMPVQTITAISWRSKTPVTSSPKCLLVSVQVSSTCAFAVLTRLAASRVGHMRFSYMYDGPDIAPHVVIQASRPSVVMSGDNVFTRATTNVSYPTGSVTIDGERQEVYGWNDERQEWVIHHPR